MQCSYIIPTSLIIILVVVEVAVVAVVITVVEVVVAVVVLAVLVAVCCKSDVLWHAVSFFPYKNTHFFYCDRMNSFIEI